MNVSSCTPASAEPPPTVKPGGFPGIGSCADTAQSSAEAATAAAVRSFDQDDGIAFAASGDLGE